MKNIFNDLYIILILVVFATSCKKDLLEKSPADGFESDVVWSDPNLVDAFVNARYNQIGHGWYAESWQSSMCDETFLTWSRDCEPVNQGYVSPSFIGAMNGGHWGESIRRWDMIWKNISFCNVFFDNIEKTIFADATLKKNRIAEVTFIRALMYWDLINRWGGMPIITKSYGIDNVSEIKDIKRNTYKENIDFVVSECDKAAAALPASYGDAKNKGRATSVAALALKSRVLLYAASPLMNQSGANPLTGYSSPDPDRWKKAEQAAQAAISLAQANGYELFDKYGDNIVQKYTGLFMEGGNPEVIFDRQGGSSASSTNLSYLDEANGPNGYGNWGGNTPIQEFVDAFEMSDGSLFDWSNPVHAADPYANRDPRLKATVLCNGDMWKGRKIETFLFKKADGSETGGLDTKYGSNSWNTSLTGYYVRKFLDESYSAGSWSFNPKNWIWFRLGELYLNLAEAKFNIGDEGAAKAALKKIRDRARMPAVTASGAALWNAIIYERRIELAFEEHRYFDTRRWMIAQDLLNNNATGIKIFKNVNGTFTYTPGALVETRKFVTPRMYWLPIQLDEINKNQNLQQNPAYTN